MDQFNVFCLKVCNSSSLISSCKHLSTYVVGLGISYLGQFSRLKIEQLSCSDQLQDNRIWLDKEN